MHCTTSSLWGFRNVPAFCFMAVEFHLPSPWQWIWIKNPLPAHLSTVPFFSDNWRSSTVSAATTTSVGTVTTWGSPLRHAVLLLVRSDMSQGFYNRFDLHLHWHQQPSQQNFMSETELLCFRVTALGKWKCPRPWTHNWKGPSHSNLCSEVQALSLIYGHSRPRVQACAWLIWSFKSISCAPLPV